MGIQLNGKQHQEIYFGGHYHQAVYKGNALYWEKQANLLKPSWAVGKSAVINGLSINTGENGMVTFDGTYYSTGNMNLCFAPEFLNNSGRPDSWITTTILPKGRKYRLEIKVLSGSISLTSGSTNTNSFNAALGIKASGNGAAMQCNLLEKSFVAEATPTTDIATARLFIASQVHIKVEQYRIQYVVTEV